MYRVFLLFVLFLPALSAFSEVPNTIRIGVIVPLSGDMAFAGEDIKNGLLLAKEESKDSKFDYQFLFEDNALELRKTATAAQKLIKLDKVDLLVSLWPPSANVIAPIAEANKLPHYTIAWDPEIARKHKYTFSHQAMVNSYVKATLELLDHNNFSKVAFFQLNESGFNIGTDFVRSLSKEHGIEIVSEVIFNSGQSDFRTEISKSAQKKPDVFLIWGVMPESEIIIKQIRSAGIDLPVTGFFDVIQDLSLIEGMSFVSEISATENFEKAFEQHYGKPFRMKAPNAYDIFNIVRKVYESNPSEKITADEFAQKVTLVKNYPGAVGVVDVDNYGNSEYPASWKKVVKGKLVSLTK